jgi:hypothetical protein
MTRIDRLSYRQVIKANVTTRVKQLLILVLTVIFGVLVSVSVNAQKSFGKTAEKKKTRFYKISARAMANHYANACEVLHRKRTNPSRNTSFRPGKSAVARKGKAASGLVDEKSFRSAIPAQNSIIREMVGQCLKERKDASPIELAPLVFSINNNKVLVSDVNPFLIAVEFGLQGKTILIQDQIMKDLDADSKSAVLREISVLMQKMGVPGDQISIAGQGAGTSAREATDFSISFTAL